MWFFYHMGKVAHYPCVAIVQSVMVVPMSEWLSLSLVLGGTAVSMALLLVARPRLTGTTIVAVWGWALVSIASIAVVEVAIYLLGNEIARNTREAFRWSAACSTLCPMMAQLGAKRPQDRGWQWIVLSLWVILSLPSAEALFLGRTFQLSMVWCSFANLLAVIGISNMLLTRYGFSAISVYLAQLALVLGTHSIQNMWTTAGICLLATAAVLAFWLPRRRHPPTTTLDRVWFDFRDMFGAVWAIRIGEQLNKSSEFQDWGVTVGWYGFTYTVTGKPATDLPAETEAAIVRSLRTMLRRFVSPEWLDARLPPPRV